MPKINQKEYEILKGLDDKWKWVVRGKGHVEIYEEKPYKDNDGDWWWVSGSDIEDLDAKAHLFKFIQRSDKEPYNIAELIEEYENHEREEKEVKDIEWLKDKISKIAVYTAGDFDFDWAVSLSQINEIIDQLDEPETLSQEWIDEHKVMRVNNRRQMITSDVVPIDDLQNLLVPKQELPVIPQFVAEYLDFAKSDTTLMRVLELANIRGEWEKWEKEYDWIEENHETFARAWLDGYSVEEKKYQVAVDHENGDWTYASDGRRSFKTTDKTKAETLAEIFGGRVIAEEMEE